MESFKEFYYNESIKTAAQSLLAATMLGASVLTSNAHEIISLPIKFITALNQVEASGKHDNVAPGDKNQALGPFQIHKAYWRDAVEFEPALAKSHKYEDVNNYDYAVKIITAYLNRYGKKYMQSNNFDALARIHNGGPNALFPNRKSLTDSYVQRFEKAFKKSY